MRLYEGRDNANPPNIYFVDVEGTIDGDNLILSSVTWGNPTSRPMYVTFQRLNRSNILSLVIDPQSSGTQNFQGSQANRTLVWWNISWG